MNKLLILTCAAAIGIAANAATLNLSDVTADTTIADGTLVTGTLSRNVKLTIAEGAEIFLSGVTINGGNVENSSCKWAGLTCAGNATIILVGESTVNGFYGEHPGIYVPEGYTLTIKGSGSLNAGGRSEGAGIGGAFNASCGNIVIESGTITATGGIRAAGIGSGQYGKCSGITISGGSVTATGNKAAGIGSGRQGVCGNITISGGTVTATGDDVGIGSAWYGFCGSIDISGGTVEANCNVSGGAGIGTGWHGSCGIIAISGGDVTALTDGGSAAGIGSGKEGSCGRIYIESGITSIFARAWDESVAHIGAGSGGICGEVVVDDSLEDMTIAGYGYRFITSKVVNLANVTENTTITDGKIITGTLAANVKVFIADGATVTLRDVTINGVNNSNYEWAGLTCVGNATIKLEGVNTVKGFYENYPGIYVPANKTLTINGSGVLNASSNGYAPGIGGAYNLSCGNIRIEGGKINAKGGRFSAGIGGGAYGDCGDITITEGATSVTAEKGPAGDFSIGRGNDDRSCGTVTIGGVVGEISQSPYTYYGMLPAPAFAADGKAATTEFVKGENGKWTLTTFAELGNDALGADVANSQIKVYSASTVEGLESASPMSSGVEVKEKKSAVKTTIEVTPPSGASQFFKVKFGE